MRNLGYFISVFTIVSTLQTLTLMASEKPEREYLVTDIEGNAGVIPKGKTEISPLKENFLIIPGDRIITGKSGRVELSNEEGTILEIGEESDLTIESISHSVSSFFLRIGRLLGKFKTFKKPSYTYNFNTPVAVAAVRGTELVLDVQPDGELQAGVVEGEVEFGPAEESDSSLWEEKVRIKNSEGLVVKPKKKPVRMTQIPPPYPRCGRPVSPYSKTCSASTRNMEKTPPIRKP